MAEIKFSQLSTATQLTNDDIVAMSQMQGGALSSVKTTLIAIANFLNTQVQYTSAYNTQSKTTAGAINELKTLISLIPQFSIEVVQELPTEDISDTTIYLVPAEDPEVGNYYEEYIHVNNTWELVGTTAVDLSAYYTKLEVDGLLTDKLEADDFEANQTASANPITLKTKQAGLAKSCVVKMNPIQSGTGDPSPTNIRPITGRIEVSVKRTGKNEIDEDFLLLATGWTKSGGEYSGINTALHTAFSGGYSGDIKFIENTQYTVSFDFKANEDKITVFGFKYSDGTTSTSYITNTTYERKNFTSTINKTVVGILFSYGGSTTVHIKDFQLELGSTATSYEPYNGYEVTIDLNGTRYGGTLDVTEGVLTVDMAIVDLGDLNWLKWSNGNFFYVSLPGARFETGGSYKANAISSQYSVCTVSQVSTTDKSFAIGTYYIGTVTLYVRDETYLSGTASDFKTAMSGVQLVYELATPTTVTLTPTQITALLGENNVSASTGDITECIYRGDIKKFVESKLG